MDQYVKPLTLVLGVVLTLVGLAGFFLASPLLGYFEVDAVHNVIHILSGVVALGAAKTYSYARSYLILFGLVYGVVTLWGLFVGSSVLWLFTVNAADNYLHLAITAVCLIVGLGAKQNA